MGGRNPNLARHGPGSGKPPGGVIAIFGPTASGKTAVAQALAERVAAHVVSADSMQVYQGVPILTNQPEQPTALVGIWTLDHEASLVEFAALAHAEIDDALARGRTPIVVGGTGLYLRAALAAMDVPPAPEPGARERLERLYDRVGPERAHAVLGAHDAEAASRVHPNDRRRVVRALELVEVGSSLNPGADQLWGGDTRHPTLVVGLDVPRNVLAARIEERTREMLARGVEAEVERAQAGAISTTARAMIGLEEIGSLPRDAAAEAIVARTRRYAAYQRKWMRRIPGVVSVAADRPPVVIADEILEVARARQLLPAARAG